MNNLENKDYERIINQWYDQVKNVESATLRLKLKEKDDFLALINFVLICQKNKNKKYNLEIQCTNTDDEYRIKHYLYACRSCLNEVKINNKKYVNLAEVNFSKILPLISIDLACYEFLSTKIKDLEKKFNIVIGNSLFDTIKKEDRNSPFTVEQKCLLRASLSYLYGDVENITELTKARQQYFETESFKNQIRDLPFLAFLIFAAYDRVNHEECANEYKEEIRLNSPNKTISLRLIDMPDALPKDEDIIADIFNAWDLADGILQLIENIVDHAGDVEKSGMGILSMRIHSNSDNTYLSNEYDQYFKGYEYRYKDEYGRLDGAGGLIEKTEKDFFSDAHHELKRVINQGRYVEKDFISTYNEIRDKIERRRDVRRKTKYYLEVMVADISGKNVCDVFRDNLAKRNDEYANSFEDITVRSFFDPTREEKNRFEGYYQAKNIIHHYGLQIFLSIVVNNDGFFFIRSHSNTNNSAYSSTESVADINWSGLMEGTRYQILLPFRRHGNPQNSMINPSIKYHINDVNSLEVIKEDNKHIAEFYQILDTYDIENNSKEVFVRDLEKILPRNKNQILVFDVEKIRTSTMEVFCKTLIFYIANRSQEDELSNMAIVNCVREDFINIIRFFTICYDKNGKGNWMRNTQVYLCGKDTREEFLLSGESLHVLFTRVEKLAFSRRIHPLCVQIIQKVLERRHNEVKDDIYANFNYTPFDLLLEKDGRTIFENNVKKILENNIQSIESGCKIEPTHMRIGSKIHINAFYEAELLFFNNYYTYRFASLIFKELEKNIQKLGQSEELVKPVCFVGYETYSEMLLCELQHIFEERYNSSASYMIYEIQTDGIVNLRYNETVKSDMQFVLVVPINTTLTTFNKLQAEIEKKFKEHPIIAYMGVIQIRNKVNSEKGEKQEKNIEREFWVYCDDNERKIYSDKLLGRGRYASYLVEVSCKWEDPLECSQCFPQDCLCEMPLIETNKSSVVPRQLIGLKEVSKYAGRVKGDRLSGAGDVDSLENYFYYGHIMRDDNHFRFYIRTASYFQEYQTDIRDWLKRVKKKIEKGDNVSYNIIVSPMHFSNTAFVEAVNEVVFDGASYVLRIEPEKEFRDNVQTKYSDLSALYSNLMLNGQNASINFYYVDDMIVTGKGFQRVKHLLSSLFPNQRTNVKLFDSIIVLVNRLSEYSIESYVDDSKDYYSYVDLNISNLRSHEDACFICKMEMDNQKLADYSATNVVNSYWENRRDKYRILSLADAKKYANVLKQQMKNEHEKIVYKRPFLRMKATHQLNNELGQLGVLQNNTSDVYKAIIEQICSSDIADQYETLTAYLYSAAYPFVVYRKSVREAIFRMVIILLELLVMGETWKNMQHRVESSIITPEASKELIFILNESAGLQKIVKNVSNKEELLKFLLKISVELRCNYIIRPDRMEKIIKKYYNLVKNDKKYYTDAGVNKKNNGRDNLESKLAEFEVYYVALVKKLIALNADESKSTYFEKAIVANVRSVNTDFRKRFDNINAYVSGIRVALFLENTNCILDAICDMNKNTIMLEEYYLTNYVRTLDLNGISGKSDKEKVSKCFVKVYAHLTNDGLANTISHKDYGGDFKRYIEYYNDLAKNIKNLTKAQNVQFVFANNERQLKIDEDRNVVFDYDCIRYEIFAHSEAEEVAKVLVPDEQISGMLENLLLDTISIKNNIVILAYKKDKNKHKEEGKSLTSYFEPVYLILKFKEEDVDAIIPLIRRVVIFRHMIISRLEKDFSNNVMQNWLEQARIIRQLEKARAFVHASNSNNDDENNVWNMCTKLFFDTEVEKEKAKKKYETNGLGYILELMTDIRIGRINLKLLSNSEFTTTRYKRLTFDTIKEYFEPLKLAYYRSSVCLCDESGRVISDGIFDESIYGSELARNRNGEYDSISLYLMYLIYETIHSAAIYGKKESDGKVHIKIYKEGKYLYVCNPMDGKNKETQIVRGLSRKGNGISLAVICEYFIKEYENRYVKLYLEPDEFKIGLPIFEEDAKDELKNLFD